LKPDNVGDILQLHRNLASAIWAKAPLNGFSAVANATVVTKLAMQPQPLSRNNENGRISAAAGSLAVAAMAV
jgi:hypothetical protein